LQARDEHGEPLSDRQIRDELVTMFIAGHETTATTLSWVWYILSTLPEVEERVHAEIDQVFGGNLPTVEEISRLHYTNMVVSETLRLHPAAFAFTRRAKTDDAIGGYRIPKGSMIFVTTFWTQQHPEFWSDPLRFDPDRFAPEQLAKQHKFAYFPFGGGPRQCIGKGFSLFEIPLVCAIIAQHYRLRLVPGHPIEQWVALTMRPRYGLPMTLREDVRS